MGTYAVDWVDAFTDRPFGGNGCAVVHDAAGLDDATCMAFVKETSLVECTFVEASDIADVKVRYFIASKEIPFAGHPTVATAAALRSRGVLTGPKMRFETKAGVIHIDVIEADGGPTYTMTQAPPDFGAQSDPASIAAIYGLRASDVVGTPQFVSTGLGFTITVLASQDALRRAVLDSDLLRQHCATLGAPDGHMAEPYLVTLRGATKVGSTFARLLMLPPSPPEDPFTGSATGATAAYLWKHKLIDTPRYVAEQGHDMGRPGQAQVEITGPHGAPERIRVGGQAHVLMSGTLAL
ncbi:PhzF family phenazine biosynthesis protein [Shimia ponticola]|uniref:PhzF family phenazine biosynthesis protein n=1 Tax=Shimia ponticola TaxID=2582893 RepID=UPI0011BF6C1B|nr:PhzF family phenazine biosynthesis protein [Shimia ponticola]